jgi:hypothetical protein
MPVGRKRKGRVGAQSGESGSARGASGPLAEMRIDDVIERMQTAYRTGTDAELAAKLGVGRTTISAWRARDSIPFRQCARAAYETGTPLDWLLLGKDARRGYSPSESDLDERILAIVIRAREWDRPDSQLSGSAFRSEWERDLARAQLLAREYLRYLSLTNMAEARGVSRDEFIEDLRRAVQSARRAT